jgi:GTP cyclohydrolase I
MMFHTAKYLRRLFEEYGENPEREGLVDTPNRVLRAWREILKGYKSEPRNILSATFQSSAAGIVCCKEIEFYSTCEHHLLPFFGRAHIAYIPDGKVVGVSKLVRLVECYAQRLQIQEEITERVSSDLMTYLQPRGCMVVVEAQHLCMKARGVKNHSSVMVTSSIRGCFDDHAIRMETLKLFGM